MAILRETFGAGLFAWPGPLVNGTPAPLPDVAASFFEALMVRVMGGIPDLLGGFLRETDGRARSPYLVLSPLWEDPEWNTGGSAYAEWSHVQLTMVSWGDDAAAESLSLRDRAYRLFAPKKAAGAPLYRPLRFSDGLDGGCLPGRKYGARKPVKGPNNAPIWTASFDAAFYLTRYM